MPLPGWYARARLADVVEQRRQAGDPEVVGGRAIVDGGRAHVLDDGDRVAEHVLVAMDRIVLEAQRRELGRKCSAKPGVDEEPQAGGRTVEGDQLVELVADPLGRHDLEPIGLADDGGDQVGIGFEPKRAMKRAARSMRNGSSPKLISGASGVRSTLRRGRRPHRTGRRAPDRPPAVGGDLEGDGVDREVAALRSSSMRSENVTCGLRESSVYDSERNVVIS